MCRVGVGLECRVGVIFGLEFESSRVGCAGSVGFWGIGPSRAWCAPVPGCPRVRFCVRMRETCEKVYIPYIPYIVRFKTLVFILFNPTLNPTPTLHDFGGIR